jgi:hypothetical protein
MLSRVMRLGVLTLVVGCLASSVWAQAGRTGVSGTVFDQKKAVLPGATVTATNEATGITRSASAG